MADIKDSLNQEYMRRAILLAKKARGFTNPNPMVGAVIVKEGRIIAEGYHRKCGELHAERDAFTHLTESADGATIYVTLEPCCHYGKQPPCTEAIVEHGISRVVIGSRDPNPLVAGKGVKYLKEHGIEVIEDYLRDECDEINPVFFHYITTKKPYVVMKYAMTTDGKIATKTGASKWITGKEARENVMKERASYASILAGIGTVLADDPTLNVRIDDGNEYHQPVRVIVDTNLRIPLDSNIVKTADKYRTIVAYNGAFAGNSEKNISEKKDALNKAGVETVNIASSDVSQPGVSVQLLMEYLGSQSIDSVYVEGGGTIHESFMKSGFVDKVSCYIAPKIFGGSDAKTPVEGSGVSLVEDALMLKLKNTTVLGEDIWLEYEASASILN